MARQREENGWSKLYKYQTTKKILSAKNHYPYPHSTIDAWTKHIELSRVSIPLSAQRILCRFRTNFSLKLIHQLFTVKSPGTTEIFRQATFGPHKWHSNVKELEVNKAIENKEELSYAKLQLGIKSSECGLLWLKWNRSTDNIGVNVPADIVQLTKRGILRTVAEIYNREIVQV